METPANKVTGANSRPVLQFEGGEFGEALCWSKVTCVITARQAVTHF